MRKVPLYNPRALGLNTPSPSRPTALLPDYLDGPQRLISYRLNRQLTLDAGITDIQHMQMIFDACIHLDATLQSPTQEDRVGASKYIRPSSSLPFSSKVPAGSNSIEPHNMSRPLFLIVVIDAFRTQEFTRPFFFLGGGNHFSACSQLEICPTKNAQDLFDWFRDVDVSFPSSWRGVPRAFLQFGFCIPLWEKKNCSSLTVVSCGWSR